MGSFVLSKLCFLTILCLLAQHATAVFWGTFNQSPAFHNVRGGVRLLNRKTIRLEDFYWDGGGIRVYAYYYSPGATPSHSGGGTIIPVPGGGSDGRFALGRAYNGEIFDIPLPDGLDACAIGTFAIWCEPARTLFNHVTLTRDVFLNGGASPCTLPPENIEVPLTTPAPPEFDNCKFLDPSLQMRWRVNREDSNMRVQLCGCLSSNPNVNQYMGFGVSGSNSSTLMFGADPTITWVDTNSQANAIDYHLSGYTQCVVSVGQGACPDSVDSSGNCTNDATLIGGFRDDSQQCVTFTRPFTPSDVGTCDRPLDPDNMNQYIVWGVGGLGETAFRHFDRAQATDGPVHLGRDSLDECGNTALTCQTCPPYVGQQIIALEDTTFRAVIGPSGNQRGYMSITGLPGWGIAWYINGTLIPELVVQRGRTYTFLIEGGDDTNILAIYHPFYITSSVSGGRLQADTTTRDSEIVYAGFNGEEATAFGRLCELSESPAALASRTACQDLDDYLSKLEESSGCSTGQPGTLTWTPDSSTPDTVYYQCATHLNLGWRIQVRDPPVTSQPTTAITTDGLSTVQETTPTSEPITTPISETTPTDQPETTPTSLPETTSTAEPETTPTVGDGGALKLIASSLSVLLLVVATRLFGP